MRCPHAPPPLALLSPPSDAPRRSATLRVAQGRLRKAPLPRLATTAARAHARPAVPAFCAQRLPSDSSPTCCPRPTLPPTAIALEVVELLKQAGFQAEADASFNPKRAPVIVPKVKGEEDGLVYTPDDKTSVNALGVDPRLNVVCKCERVTEAEVVDACRRSLPLDSTQGIRKRTRAGMGGCQGKPWNYGCECRVAQIIERETKAASDEAAGVAAVGRRPWPATSLFPRRWITPEDKEVLQAVSELSADPAADDALFDKAEAALPLQVCQKPSEKEA